MTQPLFGIISGTEKAVERAAQIGADFVALHFRGNPELLYPAIEALEEGNTAYVPNIEGAEIGWLPPEELCRAMEGRDRFLGFILDEAEHMQINAHWDMIAYYVQGGKHFFADTEGLDLFDIRQRYLGEFPGSLYGHFPAGLENTEWLNIWNWCRGDGVIDTLHHAVCQNPRPLDTPSTPSLDTVQDV